MTDYTEVKPFSTALSRWRDAYGPKPTHEQFATAVALTQALRSRTSGVGIESGHLAMCLRPDGCDASHFRAVFKAGNAFNKMRDLLTAGYVKRETPSKGVNKLTLTPRGQKAYDRWVAAGSVVEAEPVQGKAKAKKRTSKPRKEIAVPATVNEPIANEPALPETVPTD